MHREYRPEDLHHIERSAVIAPAGGATDDQDRALFAFTALLALLIGGDLLLSLSGMGRLPAGLSLSLIAAILGAVYIVYGCSQDALAGSDRGRSGTGAGFAGGTRVGATVRRGRGGFHLPLGRGSRGVDLFACATGDGPAG